jgi:hypothetical protein
MSETQSVDFAIFNNEQVTCVGAQVMGTSHDRKSDHTPNLFFEINFGVGLSSLAKTIR